MQGKKQFTQQLFYELSLERMVPQDNFYREAALCYNLKKYMKFTRKKSKSQAQAMSKVAEMLFSLKKDFSYSF